MNNDRLEIESQRISRLEIDVDDLRKSNHKFEAKIDILTSRVDAIYKKLENGISTSLNEINKSVQELQESKRWSDIFKNLVIVAISSLVTGGVAFILHNSLIK